MNPPLKLQYDDRFLVELFKKWHEDAEYEIEAAKNNAPINDGKHLIAQFDRVKLLLGQSGRDLRGATSKQWQDFTEGTDILATNVEVAQHMEFSQKLEAGEICEEVKAQKLVKMFENMRRESLQTQKKTFREEQAQQRSMGAISVDATNLPQMRFSLLKLQRIVPKTERYQRTVSSGAWWRISY
ncbi:unnamed protein product [Alternaria alternata]